MLYKPCCVLSKATVIHLSLQCTLLVIGVLDLLCVTYVALLFKYGCSQGPNNGPLNKINLIVPILFRSGIQIPTSNLSGSQAITWCVTNWAIQAWIQGWCVHILNCGVLSVEDWAPVPSQTEGTCSLIGVHQGHIMTSSARNVIVIRMYYAKYTINH